MQTGSHGAALALEGRVSGAKHVEGWSKAWTLARVMGVTNAGTGGDGNVRLLEAPWSPLWIFARVPSYLKLGRGGLGTSGPLSAVKVDRQDGTDMVRSSGQRLFVRIRTEYCS